MVAGVSIFNLTYHHIKKDKLGNKVKKHDNFYNKTKMMKYLQEAPNSRT